MAKAKLQSIPAEEETLPNRSVLIPEGLIAQRAYALYLARGREDGHDVEDWLQAERELQEIKNALLKLACRANPVGAVALA